MSHGDKPQAKKKPKKGLAGVGFILLYNECIEGGPH